MSKHAHRGRPSGLLRITTSVALAATAVIAGSAGITSAQAATGSGPWQITTADGITTTTNINAVGDGFGVSKKWICHPVPGSGELHDGWDLIDPADPSKHIDEDAFNAGVQPYGWHSVTDSDGTVRTDVYATLLTTEDPKHVKDGLLACPGTVNHVQDLTVADTLDPTFDRKWIWDLQKTVDDNDVTLYSNRQPGDHEATVNWKLDASATSTDYNFQVSGAVDVTNKGTDPADFTVTVTGIAGAVVDCGAGTDTVAALAVADTAHCSWTAPASDTKPTGDITATAAIDADTFWTDVDTIAFGDVPANDPGTDYNNTISDARVGLVNFPITANTGYHQSFPETFKWSDNPCNDSVENNDASLGTGEKDSASVNVHRVCLEHLSVTQKVATSYNRHYSWTLTKTADKKDVYLYSPHATGAHTGTINWTVTATPSAAIDDNFKVAGTITVTNDGDKAATFDASTDLPAATNVDCGQGTGATATLAVDASVDCTWSVMGKPAGPVTATATTATDSYSSTATPITWGSPTLPIVGATTTLSDPFSTACGSTTPLAATGGQVVKHCSTTVNWADKACGNSVVTNTATLSTNATPASASVNVHRQCERFASDTAWATAGGAGTSKYNGMTNGNWATYVAAPASGTATYNIFAGQTKAAGTMTMDASGNFAITLKNGFVFQSGVTNLHIQGYSTPPSGNPAPGQFAFKKTCSGTSCSGKVTVAKYYGIHLSVGVWVPDPNFGP